MIARRLMGLEDTIGLSFVDPIRDERGWAFTGGDYVDPVNGFEFLGAAYMATDPNYDARVSVPVATGRLGPPLSVRGARVGGALGRSFSVRRRPGGPRRTSRT
jgi:putative glutathione S-transferase